MSRCRATSKIASRNVQSTDIRDAPAQSAYLAQGGNAPLETPDEVKSEKCFPHRALTYPPMISTLAKRRRKIRRKVNDCLYYRTRIDTLSFTLPKIKARQLRQVAREYNLKLSTYIRSIAVAHTEGYNPIPARIERALEKLQVLVAQVGTTLMSINGRLSTSQRSFIFDPLEAKKKLEKLIDRLENFIRNPSSFDDSQVNDQESR